MTATANYRFQFVSSGLGTVSYQFWLGDQSGRIEYRSDAMPFELSHFNGDREQYERQVVQGIGILYRRGGYGPIEQELVDAFNAYRQTEHEEFLHWLETRPSLSASVPIDDPLRRATVEPLHGGYYDIDQGTWARI